MLRLMLQWPLLQHKESRDEMVEAFLVPVLVLKIKILISFRVFKNQALKVSNLLHSNLTKLELVFILQ